MLSERLKSNASYSMNLEAGIQQKNTNKVSSPTYMTSGSQVDNNATVISERIIQHEIVVPKRVVREEVIEKVLIVPETVVREEIIEEVQTIKETIIEIAKPVYHEKIVEVPQVEYRDKIVEVVEKVVEQKVKKVPKIEYKERVVEVEKYVDFDGNVIDPPETECREVIIEKIIEIPEVQEQVIVREVPVPRYVETVLNTQIKSGINIPVPLEAVTTYNYELQHPKPILNEVEYPMYAPRFIEVPVAAEFFDPSQLQELHTTQQRLQKLNQQQVPLSEVERLATDIQQQTYLTTEPSPEMFKSAITQAWKSGQLNMVSPDAQISAT